MQMIEQALQHPIRFSRIEVPVPSRIDAAFQPSDLPWRDFESGSQEDRKVERVVPNALSWVRCHRLAAASRSTSRFSCVPAFLISASSIVRAA